jgi:hypothetical protein
MKHLNKTRFSAATLSALSVAVLTALSSSASSAAGGGASNAGGKPFVQLENQIIEVQNTLTQTIEQQIQNLTTTVINSDTSLADRVALLEGKVLSLEDRIAISEQNIASLNTTATNLQNQINGLIATASQQGVDILALQNQLTTTNEQISALLAQSGDHSSEIEALKLTAASLQNQIEINASGITGLQEQLNETKEILTGLQGQLTNFQNALQAKQDILDGKCPDGMALKEIRADGAIVCGMLGANGLEFHQVSQRLWLDAWEANTQYCPQGFFATGGGFWEVAGHGDHVHVNRPYGSNGWQVGVRSDDYVWTYVNCLRMR